MGHCVMGPGSSPLIAPGKHLHSESIFVDSNDFQSCGDASNPASHPYISRSWVGGVHAIPYLTMPCNTIPCRHRPTSPHFTPPHPTVAPAASSCSGLELRHGSADRTRPQGGWHAGGWLVGGRPAGGVDFRMGSPSLKHSIPLSSFGWLAQRSTGDRRRSLPHVAACWARCAFHRD